MVGRTVRISKYVVPDPDKGMIRGVAMPLAILLGAYIIVNKTGLRIPIISDAVDRFVIPIQHGAHDLKEWAEDQQRGASGLGLMFGIPGWALGSLIDAVGVAMMGGIFFLVPDSGRHGDHIHMIARGLKPSTPLKYGWRSGVNFPGYEAQYVSKADGTWNGPDSDEFAEFTDVYIIIANTTPPGQYKVYIDQRPWGGGYGERNFTVLA